jgi:predicted enzyme related to lactoylglutathione lyase
LASDIVQWTSTPPSFLPSEIDQSSFLPEVLDFVRVLGWFLVRPEEEIVERVLGIGGIFMKARDPKGLAAWYRDHLGVPVDANQTYGTFTAGNAAGAQEQTVWSTFPMDTTYFAPSTAPFMVNYRVADLDKMLAQLRAAGAQVEDRVDDYDYGRFGWALDPEGNRIELWQPLGPGF